MRRAEMGGGCGSTTGTHQYNHMHMRKWEGGIRSTHRIGMRKRSARVRTIHSTLRIPGIRPTLRIPGIRSTLRIYGIRSALRIPGIRSTLRIPEFVPRCAFPEHFGRNTHGAHKNNRRGRLFGGPRRPMAMPACAAGRGQWPLHAAYPRTRPRRTIGRQRGRVCRNSFHAARCRSQIVQSRARRAPTCARPPKPVLRGLWRRVRRASGPLGTCGAPARGRNKCWSFGRIRQRFWKIDSWVSRLIFIRCQKKYEREPLLFSDSRSESQGLLVFGKRSRHNTNSYKRFLQHRGHWLRAGRPKGRPGRCAVARGEPDCR